MAFFGSGQKTTTTVKPSAQVDAILRRVIQQTQELNRPGNQQFIDQQMADLTPNQQAALQRMIQSPELQQIQNMYSPLTQQGLNQMENISSNLRNLSNSPIGAREVVDYKNQMQNSRLAKTTAAAPSNVSLGTAGSSDSLRRSGAVGAQRQSALTNLNRNQAATNAGIGNLLAGQDFQRGLLGTQSGIAGRNVSLGASGTQAGQQAIQNALNAGNIQQQQQNALNNLNWQNQIGRQQFGWNQLNNQLNVLNQVSPMAGYTIKNALPGQSVGQQVLGAGITGLGIAGRMGAFSPSQQETNAWNSYNASGGQSGMAGPMQGGGNLSQQGGQTPGFWGNYGSNILGGVLGAFGAV